MPSPVSRTRTTPRIVFFRERDGDVAASGREFQRVEQHVPEDLLQPISVRSHKQKLGGFGEPHSDAFLLGHVRRRFHRASHDVRQVVGFQIERELAARGAIQLEKIFDQPELKESVPLDHLDRAGDLSRMLSQLEHARPPENRRERRSQFVRQHGQKLVLHSGGHGELRRRFFVLPRAVILAEQRVSKHLQQFSVQDETALRNGRLLTRHIP